jgi:hypothetical protein
LYLHRCGVPPPLIDHGGKLFWFVFVFLLSCSSRFLAAYSALQKMASTSWAHSGRIFFNASRVYYLPDEPSLPPLRWMAEKQQFEVFSSANSEDVELRASITELVQACSQLHHLQSVQQHSIAASLSCYLPCEAIYGVLPLGSVNSALIYVTEKEYTCTLCVGGATHEVYAVKGLQWLNLPCVTSSALSQRQRRRRERRERRPHSRRGDRSRATTSDEHDADGLGGSRHNNNKGWDRGAQQHQQESATDEEDEGSATDTSEEEEEDDDDDDDASEEVGRLPIKTVNDYLAVLNRFCETVNTQDGPQHVAARRDGNGKADDATSMSASKLTGIIDQAKKFSYLFYSPTLDLSADPVHLLGLITHTPYPGLALHSAPKGEVVDNSLSTTTTSHNEVGGSDTNPDLANTIKASRHGGHHAWEDLRAAATTRQLYQWNGALLSEGFSLPTMATLRRELHHHRHHQGGDTGASDLLELGNDADEDDEAVLPWRGVCAEEVQCDARAHRQHRDAAHLANPATPGSATTTTSSQSPSSMPLYVPSFIRGLVAQADASSTAVMTLVTRTCCRWAGTRYNRRGLEPGHSGVVANMSMTSLWVTKRLCSSETFAKTQKTAASDDSGVAARTTPFAVYTVMRGSVPRRWEQPANLSLKPTIKISPLSNAAEELARHIRLLKQCHPQLHQLFCLDTMSLSALEEPLAEAFAAAVKRYSDGASKAATPSTSLVVEEKDSGTAHAAGEEGGGAAAVTNTAERDPAVTLVKFNVKKQLKVHDYEAMARRCVAELDSVAGDDDTWLDFTHGHARCMNDTEEEEEGFTASSTSGCIGGVADGSNLSASLSNTVACVRDAAERSDEHARAATATPRLVFDHVQSRLVRVNCLDCLDRTNLVQSILLCAVLPRMMAYVDGAAPPTAGDAVESGSSSGPQSCTPAALVALCLHDPLYAVASHQLRRLVASQGTAISQLYAGTEPHFLPYMLNGHHHWAHKAVECVLAGRRWYQQNFFDGVKQDGISLVTRQHNPQVFNADIESPFSRDLSGMNRQVMYGLLLGILPFIYSLAMCLSEHHYASSLFQLHFAICLCWVVYLWVLYNKLMRYRVTYTNRPLLLYTRQADWC